MTWFQIYAFFGMPIIVLAGGAGLAWWAARADDIARAESPPPTTPAPRSQH